MNIWHELGIPRGADSSSIRRAYAEKLRSIDVDNNPASFMALRAAFEAAMAQATTRLARHEVEITDDEIIGDEALDDDMPDDNAPDDNAPDDNALDDNAPDNETDDKIFWHTVPAPPLDPRHEPAWHEPLQNAETAETQLQTTQKTSGTWAAFECYISLMARGDITLYNQDTLAQWLIDEAVHDYALSHENFLHMVERLGFTDSRPQYEDENLHIFIIQRVQAAHWLFALRATAAQPARWRKKHKVKAARLMLGKRKRLGRNSNLLAALKPLFIEYHAHEASLGPAIDHEAVSRLEAKLTRTLKSTRRNANLLLAMVTSFLLADTIYVVSTNIYSWLTQHHIACTTPGGCVDKSNKNGNL